MQHQDNSSYFEQLKKNMSPETLERYQKIGQDFFSNFDFEKGSMFKVQSNMDEINLIVSSLRSGLKIEDLTEDDIQTLEESLGADWKKCIECDTADLQQCQRKYCDDCCKDCCKDCRESPQ